MIYTTYDDTGFITSQINVEDIHVPKTNIIEGEYDSDEYYIVDGLPVLRIGMDNIVSINKSFPYTIIADDVDSFVISNIPNNSIFVIDYVDEKLIPVINDIVTDGIIEFETTILGTIEITIELFPYKPLTIELEAVSG